MHRIVIKKAGSVPVWYEVTSLARLAHDDMDLTPTGKLLVELFRGIVGLHYIGVDDLYTVKLRPVHELLRAWDSIEPEVIVAFAKAFGVERDDVDVIRADS